jgi:hypothetical protein
LISPSILFSLIYSSSERRAHRILHKRTLEKSSKSGHVRSGGLPTYLLDRAGDASSIDTDGASRIFKESHSSITTAKDTGTTSSAASTFSFTSMSESSVYGTSSECSNSKLRSFEHKPSSNMSFISESDETRTIRNGSTSNLNNTVRQQANEWSVLSTGSSIHMHGNVPMYGNIPICLTKDQDNNIEDDYNNYYDSNIFRDAKNMFTPYFPPYLSFLASEDKSEKEHQSESREDELHIINRTIVYFTNLDVVDSKNEKQDQAINILKYIEIRKPSIFVQCCMWGHSSVTVCGPTSHGKRPIFRAINAYLFY